jgi:hypothetical protein
MGGLQGVLGTRRGDAVDFSATAARSKPIRGWSYYLAAAALLAPVVVPNGPGQIAILDVVNAIALGVFAVWAVMNGRALKLPFVVPMLLILIGSLVATANAESVSHAFMTMAQDLYLYLWFVMIVNVLDTDSDLKRIRVAWLWAAVAVSLAGIVMVIREDPAVLSKLTALKGPRSAATFYNPNMFADYLVMSLFIAVSLAGQVRRRIMLWAASAVLLLALVATKSNGGLIMLAAGLMAWAVARSMMRDQSLTRIMGMAMLFLSIGVFTWWLGVGWGVGSGSLTAISQGSFLGRVTKSSESRLHIWSELGERYARFPLGIGPGNSREQRLSIATRERPESYLSKEAHNDYVGYLIERGPLALIGLFVLIIEALVWVVRSWSRVPDQVWKAGVGGAVAAALIGALAATSVHSLMIEKLHFRHFWLFLAVLWCFSVMAADGRRRLTPASSS